MDIDFPTSPKIDRGIPVESTSDTEETTIQPGRVENMTTTATP